MASKFSINRISVPSPASPIDLKRAFENAVREIHRADVASGSKPRYGMPIVPKAKLSNLTRGDSEKRALTDAARALAQLWKV